MNMFREGPNEKLTAALNFLAKRYESKNMVSGILNSTGSQINNYNASGSTSLPFALKLADMLKKCDIEEFDGAFEEHPSWRDFAVTHAEKIQKAVDKFK